MNRFFVSKTHRLCYASIDKAACTSLKIWIAKIDGVYDTITKQMQQYKKDNKTAISIHHAIPLFAPDLVLGTYKDIAKLFAANEYRTFTVVRNPYTRVFSAWADKVLEGHHDHTRRLLCKTDFYTRPPLDVDAMRQNFEEFVEYLCDVPELIQGDRHWIPQYFLLRPDLLRYDCVAQLENFGVLHDFVEPIVGEKFTTLLKTEARRNTSMLSYHPAFVTDRAKEMIDRLYAKDFEAFGYEKQLPQGKYDVNPAAVEAILLENMKRRITYAYKKWDLMDGKYLKLTRNPGQAFCNVGNALAFAIRAGGTRLWKRISGA